MGASRASPPRPGSTSNRTFEVLKFTGIPSGFPLLDASNRTFEVLKYDSYQETIGVKELPIAPLRY